MSKLLSLLLLPLFVLVFLVSSQSASAAACSSLVASWNQDATDSSGATNLSPLFSCQWISASKDYTYSSPTTIQPASLGRDACVCEGSRPDGHICACARTPDCSAIGGVCLKAGKAFADMVLLDGADRPEGYTINIPFRCPGDSSISCFVKVSSLASIGRPLINPESSEDSEGVISGGSDGEDVINSASPDTATETVSEPQAVRPFSNCCQEIVPKDGNSYDQGAYGLNHFIQILINVYECILCIVAALMLLMFVIGSFYLLTSAGNSATVGKGLAVIKAAVIGGIIVFASILIVNFSVKALGGSFIDSANIQINPDGGPKITPPVQTPTTVGTPPTSTSGIVTTSTTTPSGSSSTSTNPGTSAKLQFENCDSGQKLYVNMILDSLKGQSVSPLGDVNAYFAATIQKIKCVYNPASNVDAQYNYYTNQDPGGNRVYSNCPPEIELWTGFFSASKKISSAIIAHELVHRYDCQPGQIRLDSCIVEQRAFSVAADYLESIGEFDEARAKRCDWITLNYKDDQGNPCEVTDPKCI